MTQKTRTTIYLSADDKKLVDIMSKNLGINKSELYRRALSQYLHSDDYYYNSELKNIVREELENVRKNED